MMQEKNMIPGQQKVGIHALSKKEKKLLWGLLVVGVAAAMVWLLIMPQRAALAELEDAVSQLEGQQAQAKQLIARLPAAQQEYKTAQVDYEDAAKRFQPPMRAEDLDAMITQMLTDCGLSPESLKLSGMEQEAESMFGASGISAEPAPAAAGPDGAVDGAMGAAGEGTESLAEVQEDLTGGSAAAEAPATSGLASVYTVNVSAQGSIDQLYALMDRVRERGGVKLASCAWTPGQAASAPVSDEGEEEGASQAQPADSFSLVFKVYVNGGAV